MRLSIGISIPDRVARELGLLPQLPSRVYKHTKTRAQRRARKRARRAR